MPNISLAVKPSSDSLVIQKELEVEALELNLASMDIRVSAELVQGTRSSVLVINYHANSAEADIRRQERSWLGQFIEAYKAAHAELRHVVVMGDFNECAYVDGADGQKRLNPQLSTIIAEVSPHIRQLGLPPASVRKQRGSIREGNYLGPNLYLNQQSKKDGELVDDSKAAIWYFDLAQASTFRYEDLHVQSTILALDMDDTGGTDHVAARLEVEGIQLVAGGYMPTHGQKAFNDLDALYHNPADFDGIMDRQVAATQELYQLCAEACGIASPIFSDASAVRKFLDQLKPILTATPALWCEILSAWLASAAFAVAQADLIKPASTDLGVYMAKIEQDAVRKKLKANPFDVIATVLNAQPSGGYMPRVNGSLVNNDLIDAMQIAATVNACPTVGPAYLAYTEGGPKSKSPDFMCRMAEALVRRFAVFATPVDALEASLSSCQPITPTVQAAAAITFKAVKHER